MHDIKCQCVVFMKLDLFTNLTYYLCLVLEVVYYILYTTYLLTFVLIVGVFGAIESITQKSSKYVQFKWYNKSTNL